MSIIYEMVQKMRIRVGIKLYFIVTAIILIYSFDHAYAKQYTYLGVDLGYMQTDFQQDLGQDIFSKKLIPQYNIFFGHYFTSLLGFELGYAQTQTSTGNVFVPAMTNQFDLPFFTGIASNVYDTSKSMRGGNINYVPQLALAKNISVVVVVGAAYVRAKAYLTLTQFDGFAATSQQQTNYAVTFATSKFVPRLGLRLQYSLRYFGARIGYIWEQSSRLSLQATREINPAQTLIAKLQNSSTCAVGLFFKF